MSKPIVVGPASMERDISHRAKMLGGLGSLDVIKFGSIRKDAVAEWLGVEPPDGVDDLWVSLVAPDPEGRAPSPEWAYVSEGVWRWEPDGATSCFNHTDLVAIRVSA